MSVETRLIKDLTETVWPALGVEVLQEFTDRLSQRSHGDYLLRIEGKVRRVDVKGEENTPANFPIEIMQDWQSFDIGWFLTLVACDEVWYGRYAEGMTVFRVSLRAIRALDRSVTSRWPVRKCVKGQGDTIFIAAPIADLLANRACRKVWPRDLTVEINRLADEGWSKGA